MSRISVDGLGFDFVCGWTASKFDEWTFYRRHFACIHEGIKAVDLLALSPDKTLYLIEVKDYRRHRREKRTPLIEEIVLKICWTLAALPPAGINASNSGESTMARSFLGAKKFRVILHLEQPRTPSKLFPRAFDPAKVRQKLRQTLRPVDPHSDVVESSRMGTVAGKWRVY